MPMIEGDRSARKTWVFTANDYESARRARREFSSFIARNVAGTEAVYDSTLIFGELVGNAVRHVGGKVMAELAMSGRQPVLCISDTAADSRLRVPKGDFESETGRGLKIVIALARDVWVERRRNGKTICAALPCNLPRNARVERGEVSA
jgi:anti-sigma regulatory factor (Ser/Thr protein kinase)